MERRQETVDEFGGRKVDRLEQVGEDEAVDADHHRHFQAFGDAKGLDRRVDGVLIVGAVDLHPSGVPHRHRILVIVPDVDRRTDGAIGAGEHDRQTQAGDIVENLAHQQDALRRRRGVGARTRGRRAEHHRSGGKLALDADHFAIGLALGDEPGDPFDDMGLRRDRVGRDDLGTAEGDRPRKRLAAFDGDAHQATSGTVLAELHAPIGIAASARSAATRFCAATFVSNRSARAA